MRVAAISSEAPATRTAPAAIGRLQAQMLAAAALACLGDWLFHDRPLGVSLALFLMALILAATALTGARRMSAARAVAALLAAALALAPLVEDFSALAVGFGVLGVAGACRALGERRARGPLGRLLGALGAVWSGPFRLVADIARVRRAGSRIGRAPRPAAWLMRWLAPLSLAAVFVALFRQANPLVEEWIASLNPREAAEGLERGRLALWLLLFLAVWPCLRARRPARRRRGVKAPAAAQTPPAIDILTATPFLDAATVRRALILFNLLFAVQTGLDALYLWAGASLPEGVTFSEYAHRGVNPLMAAALLAGGFVLLALPPGGEAERSPAIRALAYLWLAQTLALVASALLRLDLYVAAYALTLWRAAAAVWMLLVGVGLLLVLARIVLARSNAWLASANLLVAGAALYACCFVSFPAEIARYNIAHSREMGGQGVWLDVDYLCDLGPQTLPALDEFAAAQRRARRATPERLGQCPDWLAERHRRSMAEWRGWSFRGARLLRYVEARRGDG